MISIEELHERKSGGATSIQLCRVMIEHGLTTIEVLKHLRSLYGLTLVEAKDVLVRVTHGRSLDEHQNELANDLIVMLNDDHVRNTAVRQVGPTVYVFQSSWFNMVSNASTRDPNDVPRGEDLARYLVAGLKREDVEVAHAPPLMEASYWWTQVAIEDTQFELYIHWAPLKGSNDDWWVVRFVPNRRKLRKAPEHVMECCMKLQQAIAAVLAEDESLRRPRWMTEAEFEAVY